MVRGRRRNRSVTSQGALIILNSGVAIKRTKVSPGIEAQVYRFLEKRYSSIGLGAAPFLKIYLAGKGALNVFTQIRGGPIIMFPQYPARSVNFTFYFGFGSCLNAFSKQIRIMIGYSHFSNRRKWGQLDNADWDGIGFSLGVML